MRLPWRPVGMWPDLGAAVAVRGGEGFDGLAGHEEGVEDAVLDEVDAARGLALVVDGVVAGERVAVEGGEGGVVGDGEEGGEDGLAEELGEGLALLVAALALAFEAMAEDLVEEDGGGAAGEDGWAVEGLGDGRGAEGFEVFGHRKRFVGNGLLIGQVRERVGLEGLGAEELHAVGSAGAGDDDEAGDVQGRGDAGALGGDEVVGLGRGLERGGVGEDVGELGEEGGELAEARLPRGADLASLASSGGLGGRTDLRGWLGGEVGGGVFFLGADLLLGLDFEIAVEGAGVAAVGGEPEASARGRRGRR